MQGTVWCGVVGCCGWTNGGVSTDVVVYVYTCLPHLLSLSLALSLSPSHLPPSLLLLLLPPTTRGPPLLEYASRWDHAPTLSSNHHWHLQMDVWSCVVCVCVCVHIAHTDPGRVGVVVPCTTVFVRCLKSGIYTNPPTPTLSQNATRLNVNMRYRPFNKCHV